MSPAHVRAKSSRNVTIISPGTPGTAQCVSWACHAHRQTAVTAGGGDAGGPGALLSGLLSWSAGPLDRLSAPGSDTQVLGRLSPCPSPGARGSVSSLRFSAWAGLSSRISA